ncbi:MAG: cobyric acid synthase CobQ, partial [Candidatus Hydrothermarchaeota archaeon]
ETRFEAYQKVTQRVRGKVMAKGGIFQGAEGGEIYGYEIHMGRSTLGEGTEHLLEIEGRGEGAVSRDGMVFGTYVHGIFDAPTLRGALMRHMGWKGKGTGDVRDVWRESIARAAEIVEGHLDMGAIARILEGE